MALKKFNVILAMSKNNGIGLNGKLPWHISEDMQFFKKITTEYGRNEDSKQNAVIMGRNTWESLPPKFRPLKDRVNIVLTRNPKKLSDQKGLHIAGSFDESLALIEQELKDKVSSVFVIGGTQVYEQALGHSNCKEVFLTRIGTDFECDTFLPKDSLKHYKTVETSITHSENKIPYDFNRLVQEGVNVFPQRVLDTKHQEYQYLELIDDIIKTGYRKDDRTGTGVVSKFGGQMRFDLSKSFPLLTTKDVYWKGVVEELLWFIRGETDSKTLSEKKVKIWDANGSREFLDNLGFKDREEGDLGPVYGFQWRHFGAKYKDKKTDYTGQGVDQLQWVINEIKNNPTSRRIIMSAWNPVDIPIMALPPCHVLVQFYVAGGKLSCQLYQRSCDMGLGVPFNIASYSLLCCMIADVICNFIGCY